MKPSEIIREARNVLFERGWTQHALEDEGGAVCALGALNVVDHGYPQWHFGTLHRTDEVQQLLSLAISPDAPQYQVIFFNNAEGRTFDEMIDLFDRAEKIAEQRES